MSCLGWALNVAECVLVLAEWIRCANSFQCEERLVDGCVEVATPGVASPLEFLIPCVARVGMSRPLEFSRGFTVVKIIVLLGAPVHGAEQDSCDHFPLAFKELRPHVARG